MHACVHAWFVCALFAYKSACVCVHAFVPTCVCACICEGVSSSILIQIFFF